MTYTGKTFDFSDIPIVDTHAHGPMLGKDTASYLHTSDFWYNYFVQELIPAGSTDESLRATVKESLVLQSETRPNWNSIKNYLVKAYKLNSTTTSDVEQFMKKSAQTEGVTEHALRAFKRENISWVLVDHSMVTSEPRSKMEEFPEGKKKWTHPITHLLQPKWAQEIGVDSGADVAVAIKKELQEAKRNGVSGFKSHQAYFRDFSLADVSEEEATKALGILLESKPKAFFTFPVTIPRFDPRSDEEAALKKYQDFVLKTIFCEAGRIKVPMVIHVATALTPSLKTWNNDPEKLYSVLDNDDVRRANTNFFLLHTGYPDHHKITALISQYPNVFVDLSWISANTTYLYTILDEYLSIASSTKVTHGSDTANPDVMAYAAHNTRHALSKFAAKLFDEYGWGENEIHELAENVLHRNADRIFSAS
jgi:hypothetical protein